MPKQVQKRKGYLEDFQVEKLKNSLQKSAQQAGYPEDKIFEVMEEVSGYILEKLSSLEVVDTQLIRNLILGKLDQLYPEVAQAWRKYDKEVKHREE